MILAKIAANQRDGLHQAKQDPLFEEPLHEYERILFPQSPATPAAADRLKAVRAAAVI
jgi:hypothetical protein